MEIVTLQLPKNLLADAQSVASVQDVTIGHLVRELLRKEVNRHLNAKTPNRADERLLAALQALLARDIALADGWDDLSDRLAAHGYEFRPAGGGVTLHKRTCGTRLCKGSELGFAYRKLVKRFGVGMPGHPHGNLGLSPDPSPLPDIKTRLTQIFDSAQSWVDLEAALESQGFCLRGQGSGLAIYRTRTGKHFCNTAGVGHEYRRLVKRFGGPLPEHAHMPHGLKPPPDKPEEFQVIERL